MKLVQASAEDNARARQILVDVVLPELGEALRHKMRRRIQRGSGSHLRCPLHCKVGLVPPRRRT